MGNRPFTLSQFRQAVSRDFSECFQERALFEVDDLISLYFKMPRLEVGFQEFKLKQEDLEILNQWVERRKQGEPLAYISGKVGFLGLELKVNSHTLIPRPETEELVHYIIERFSRDPSKKRVLDLGTGSGAIALSLKNSRPDWELEAVDCVTETLQIAKENAYTLNLPIHFHLGSWFEPVSGSYDLIVSNPPYIGEVEKEFLSSEVLNYEPSSALFSGEEGIDSYREIAKGLKKHLKSGGLALFEMGENQGTALKEIFRSQLELEGQIMRDLSGKERFFFIERE